MKVIAVNNVREALPAGVAYLAQHGSLEETRAGLVSVAPGPVMTIYQNPRQRVLVCPRRDANPFFHLVEAMWMLAGRDDAAFLDTYVQDFSRRFAEDTGSQWGAYGHRWRYHFEEDQLPMVVDRLTNIENDRRTVLAMWDPNYDLFPSGEAAPRDVPCNTHVYFRVAAGRLDMMVCCRSNDIIWGAYGANAVHFGFLQEYVAALVGVEVGTYYQMSFNYHAYVAVKTKLGNLEVSDPPTASMRLVENPATFEEDLHWTLSGGEARDNPFLRDVVGRAMEAHTLYRTGDREGAVKCAQNIAAEDWRVACVEWIQRRVSRTPT